MSRATPFDRHGESGFTMIEALVALALLAVMLSAIGSLVASATNSTRALEQHVALVETARLIGTSVPPHDGLSQGEVAGEVLGHRWRADVSPFFGEASAPVPNSPWIPQDVRVQVRSPSGAILTIENVRLQKRTAAK